MEEKIKKTLEVSKQVIRDCCLENGAIVAANSTKEYYSAEAKNYFYVWPRDAAYTCMAAKLVGITDIQLKFFNWAEDRAEDIDDHGKVYKKYTGLLYEKYYVNGLQAMHRFQPDQGGAMLYAISDYIKDFPQDKDKCENLLKGLADGLCKVWHEDHFNSVTNDLWEERHTFPDLSDNFTYSLGSCLTGLNTANEFIPDERYITVANEMKKEILKSGQTKGYYFRSFGLLDDLRTDASLLGLVWPFNIVKPDDKEFIATMKNILEKIGRDCKVYRYEQDEYDGWMYRGFHRKKGAGYWPLLNFWMAIVLNKMGKRDEALEFYNQVLNNIKDDCYIPEQIFDNDIQKAVSPLCWSHSMFIFATKELGLL